MYKYFYFRSTVDHTIGTSTGYYAYIESSYPQKLGDKAWLVSEVIKSLKGACLDFWYQAFVSSYITFNVYMQNGTSVAVDIYCRSGTTARDQWTYVSVNLGTIRGST